MSEEIITIMSESILDGTLNFNEGFFTKIGDGLRRFFQRRFPNTLGKINKVCTNAGVKVIFLLPALFISSSLKTVS